MSVNVMFHVTLCHESTRAHTHTYTHTHTHYFPQAKNGSGGEVNSEEVPEQSTEPIEDQQ